MSSRRSRAVALAALLVAVLAAPAAASYAPGAPPDVCAGNVFSDQIGTEGRDVLHAARRPERLWGLAGADVLRGSSTRASCLLGGRDSDILALGAGGGVAFGEHGSDLLTGSPLDDVLDGGSGNDSLLGGEGRDVMVGGDGADGYAAGAGDDLIASDDGRAEVVDCGDGADLVSADRSDALLGCEAAARSGPLLPELLPVPSAARRDQIVRVRFRAPEAATTGAYRLVLVRGPHGPGCPAPGLELTRLPGWGSKILAGRRVTVGLRPPPGGWCTGEVFAVLVVARPCASVRGCAAAPPAQPLARVSFLVA
jgi:hypothetical protein